VDFYPDAVFAQFTGAEIRFEGAEANDSVWLGNLWN
jgi:hypothetical protein